MREIKFRAWDAKQKAMFPIQELKFCEFDGELQHLSGVDIHHKDSDFHGDVYFGGPANKLTGTPPIPRFVLMQFTGLRDRNEKEIYEGDIAEIKGHPFEGSIKIDGVYEVGYNERMELCCGSWLLHRELPYITVIGNIYEHLPLLGDSQ